MLGETQRTGREPIGGPFAEVMFSAAVWSSNQDPLRPKVSCITVLKGERDKIAATSAR